MEALIAALSTLLGFGIWSHERSSRILDIRFDRIKKDIDRIDQELADLPKNYVLKSDLNAELDDIRTWLRSINDKMDKLLMFRQK